ncbi:peptidoglycan DD-metalloendopeptidase family protein [Bacillus sp. DNRA2]|nr:M23 family metallopeptidase [Bacillus sp. DNRA2]NMD70102.1 peptidoglycan DD-metalloendopeptidase family protein [Bacillus sp. DNRA2]
MREDEKKNSSRDSSIIRFFKKRWVIPAIYIASAAIILTGILWYQNSKDLGSENLDYNASDISGKKINEEPAIEVNRAMENFVMPVSTPEDVVIQKQFYEFDGKKEEQVAALIEYKNSYHPNTGIDITMRDKKAFDVVAALSGTVTDVREDSLLGNVIEIEHDKGIVTQYSSVTDIEVEAGDEVEQGQAIATAGKSLYNEKAGTHVHFEIRKDNVPVNPVDFINKPLSALQDADVKANKAAEDDSSTTDDKKATDNKDVKEEKDSTTNSKPAEDKQSTEGSKPADDKKSTDESTPSDEKSKDDSGKSEDDKSTESDKNAEPGKPAENSKKPVESSMNS